MKANLQFYFPKGTHIGSDDYTTWVRGGRVHKDLPAKITNEHKDNSMAHSIKAWILYNAEPGFNMESTNFDELGQLYVADPNGNKFVWRHGGFPTPAWYTICKLDAELVSADVTWWSSHHGVYQLGDIEEGDTTANLDIKSLAHGKQYILRVTSLNMEELNTFVRKVRTGELKPSFVWPLSSNNF